MEMLSDLLLRAAVALWRGGDTMAVVYATLIIKGVKTFEQVPAKQQEAVRTYLLALDLDQDGNPIPDAE